MKESLTKTGLTDMRCLTCRKLLFKTDHGTRFGVIEIKCPRCGACHTLRPDRAPTIECPARQTGKGDRCPPK